MARRIITENILMNFNNKKYIGLILTVMLLISCNKINIENNLIPSNSEELQVLSNYDGDTITAKLNNKKIKIRLCGIDAPELKQPFGKESRDKLSSLLNISKKAYLIKTDTDKYGRTVGEIFIPVSGEWGLEMSIQEEMLKSGMAYLYEQFARKCPNYLAFKKAEEIGRNKKTGIWASDLEKPWDYRQRNKKS